MSSSAPGPRPSGVSPDAMLGASPISAGGRDKGCRFFLTLFNLCSKFTRDAKQSRAPLRVPVSASPTSAAPPYGRCVGTQRKRCRQSSAETRRSAIGTPRRHGGATSTGRRARRAYRTAAPRSLRRARNSFSWEAGHNPLKNHDSDERIQRNPSPFLFGFPWIGLVFLGSAPATPPALPPS